MVMHDYNGVTENTKKENSLLINRERIKKIELIFSLLAYEEEGGSIYALEKYLMKEICQLSESAQEENSKLTQLLYLYFEVLYRRGRVSLDKTVHNASIVMFTEEFISHSKEIQRIFTASSLQKVVRMLIQDNLSVHRVQHANYLLEKYIGIFTELYKPLLYLDIFQSTCGVIGNEIVEDLFLKAKKTYDDQCVSVRGKAEYLYRIYSISKGANIEIPDFSSMLEDVCIQLQGDDEDYAINLFKKFCLTNEHLDKVAEWIDSLDKIELERPQDVNEVKNIYLARVNKRQVIPIELQVSGNYFEESNIDSNVGYAISEKLREDSKKVFSRSEWVKELDKAKDVYRGKIQSGKTVEEQLIAKRNFMSLEMIRPAATYWESYERNYLKVEPCKLDNESEDIFFFVNEYSLVNGAVSFPFFLEARRRGIPCYSISARINLDTCHEGDEINEYVGCIADGYDSQFYPDEFIENVEIDIKNKKIILQGMNIYQPIFEFITRYQFTYFYNYDID